MFLKYQYSSESFINNFNILTLKIVYSEFNFKET